jgi:signal peptidase I
MSPEFPMPSSESIPPTAAPLPSPSTADGYVRRFVQRATHTLLMIALAVASYWLISHFFLQSVKVVGVSMAPTLRDSQICLLNRWILYAHAPHPTDIVVIRDPSDHSFAVKRVVAVGGDSVDLSDGELRVNGRKVEESYLPQGTRTFPLPPSRQQSFKCAADQVFVLGDNRNNSMDSRAYGPVPLRDVLGLVIR